MSQPSAEVVLRAAERPLLDAMDRAKSHGTVARTDALAREMLAALVKETGITREMVDALRNHAESDEVIRPGILGGYDYTPFGGQCFAVARALSSILDAAQIPRSETE